MALKMENAEMDRFVEQYILHHDLHWGGIKMSRRKANKEILDALTLRGFDTKDYKIKFGPALRQCILWGKTHRIKPHYDDLFAWDQWDAMDKWIKANKYKFSKLETVASVYARMRLDHVVTSRRGAQEALDFSGVKLPVEPPKFTFKAAGGSDA